MLKEILENIKRNGYFSRSVLARELGVDEAMLDEGIEHLLRMQYLVEDKTGENCATVCTNCPFAKNCQKEIVKTFQISRKGNEYLLKSQGG